LQRRRHDQRRQCNCQQQNKQAVTYRHLRQASTTSHSSAHDGSARQLFPSLEAYMST
jgi:hypothetical protein